MDANPFEIDPKDDLVDVDEFEFTGPGGEPLEFVDEELFYTLSDDEDLFESADAAYAATVDALDDEADTYEYRADEADEVLEITLGKLMALRAHNAQQDDPDNPVAAAHAILAVMQVAQEIVTADLGRNAFPTLVIDGDDEMWDVVEPT